MIILSIACFLYLLYVCGTFLGIQQVMSGLKNFKFHELVMGCLLLWMSEYMIGELGPLVVEFYNKL